MFVIPLPVHWAPFESLVREINTGHFRANIVAITGVFNKYTDPPQVI